MKGKVPFVPTTNEDWLRPEKCVNVEILYDDFKNVM